MYMQTVEINVESYEEFRDSVHQTPLFDMLDCKVEIVATPTGAVDDVERIVHLIESMIHVHDVHVISEVDTQDYSIRITPVQNQTFHGKKKK
jgi:hypothetical protein